MFEYEVLLDQRKTGEHRLPARRRQPIPEGGAPRASAEAVPTRRTGGSDRERGPGWNDSELTGGRDDLNAEGVRQHLSANVPERVGTPRPRHDQPQHPMRHGAAEELPACLPQSRRQPRIAGSSTGNHQCSDARGLWQRVEHAAFARVGRLAALTD
ncbi:hypothetical protein [Saccharopolyspora elongata]|uniref:hypothetical protein n=1 Tax=Saccharopolyspora elongata TaxID=2530387 RepID=UPI0010525B6E|nr:hypothetical protein [Saccharopolyspora elongata]